MFSTGCGNPYGGFVPTVKISTNSILANKKKHWIDFDAGLLINEGESIEKLLEKLLDYLVKIINGEMTNNEKNQIKELAIFKTGVTL